jgi:hypothetical protein
MRHLFFCLTVSCMCISTLNATVIELTGSLSTQTLTSDNCYYLKGCVTVPSGNVLTINAGTIIRCESESSLTILQGGQIFSNGTSTSPVVFTSDQIPGISRTPGHWAGIAVLGYATNNIVNGGGGTIDIVRCNTYSGGGTNDADNSGVIKYTRIEFAGKGATGDTYTHGLLLNSVGNGTEINNIQVSECSQDAFMFAGGTVEAKNLISLNSYRNDFMFTFGNSSKVQFLTALRMDVAARVGSPDFSNGMIIENNPTNINYTPLTSPLISNVTLLDPSYCGRTNSTDIRNGILIRNNGRANIRNSVVSQWGNYGFYIADASSVANTANNTLNFSYNALLAKTPSNFGTGASWATGCGGSLSSMTAWINGTGLASCRESSNSFTLTAFGYNSSICDVYCTTPPTLTYSGSSLNGTDFSAPFNTFFTVTTQKGSLGTTDFSSGWSEYCPANASYCSLEAPKEQQSSWKLQLSPNPASGLVSTTFEPLKEGPATLTISDRITGKAIRTIRFKVEKAGTNTISFSVQGLREGIYPIAITMNGYKAYGQLVVK